jgi:hypothetical protein
MLPHIAKPATRALLLLMASFLLVHAGAGEGVAQTAKAKRKSEPVVAAKTATNADQLPAPVAEMRDGILEAVKSGRIEDLRVPIAWNELPPTFGTEKIDDPILYWKKQSADGEGREILAVLADLFAAGHAVVPVGKDVENSRLFVWPRFAELALDKLSPEDEVQLYRLVSPGQLKTMREQKKWTWWRLTIGADGTWHAFQKAE